MLIVGDLIIDKTWYVDARKISPEAPVPIGYLTSPNPLLSPGGAGLAASYAIKQQLKSIFLTATSKDNRLWLGEKGIDVHTLMLADNVVKTRYVDADSGYHLLRVDNDEVVDFPIITEERLELIFQDLLTDIECIVMLDYRKGMFSSVDAIKMIIARAKENNIPTYVDTRCNPLKFEGVDFLKLNRKEYNAAKAALNINLPKDLCKKINIKNLIITEGKEGAKLYLSNGQSYQYKADTKKYTGTPDVTGCGDVFDVNFCYYYFQESLEPTKALRLSVEKATKYAYMPIGDRLC
jgi:D-beta-D-heptose 7-phosphate kinase/D-beta-D-heptose 1-phosphate adenosyltransferase